MAQSVLVLGDTRVIGHCRKLLAAENPAPELRTRLSRLQKAAEAELQNVAA